jgi:hypothetical protein
MIISCSVSIQLEFQSLLADLTEYYDHPGRRLPKNEQESQRLL